MEGNPDLQPLLDHIKKKDDDMKIIQEIDKILIETDQKLVEDPIISPPNLIDDSLIENSANSPISPDVHIKVLTYLYTASLLVSFSCMIFGFIPFWILNSIRLKFEYQLIELFTVTLMFLIFYSLLIHFTLNYNAFVSKTILGVFLLILVFFVGGLAGFLNNIAPIQAMTISSLQSLSIFIYCKQSPTYVNPIKAGIICFIVGKIVWTIGIYAYIVERDWISALILFLFNILLSLYNVYQIKNIDRYNLSEDDITLAILQLFTDPILIIIKRIR